MTGKGFKKTGSSEASSAADALMASKREVPRRDPTVALAAAAEVAPTLPPTRVELPTPLQEPLAQLNLKVKASLLDQLAEAAAREGTTQKVIVCRLLAAAGYRVHADDLSDRSNHRRRRS